MQVRRFLLFILSYSYCGQTDSSELVWHKHAALSSAIFQSSLLMKNRVSVLKWFSVWRLTFPFGSSQFCNCLFSFSCRLVMC